MQIGTNFSLSIRKLGEPSDDEGTSSLERVGTLPDQSLDLGSGPFLVDASSIFLGEDISYAVIGAGTSIDAQSGLLSLNTDTIIDTETITVIATNPGGTAVTSFLFSVVLGIVAPEVTGALSDQILTQNSGALSLEAGSVFSGTGLVYSVTGTGATIDAQTGQLTLHTDMVVNAETITIEAANSLGTASTSFALSVSVAVLAPTLTGLLEDKILDKDTGYFDIDAAAVFTGSDLQFAVTGSGSNIDPDTGLLTLNTDAFLDGVVIEVVATNSAGSASTSFLLSVTEVISAPAVIGSLADQSLSQGSGAIAIETAGVFSGDALSYSVTGAGASIVAQTGLLTLTTQTALAGETIVVSASNAVGSVDISFLFTVTETGSTDDPVEIYYSSFDTDRTADFSENAQNTLVHAPGAMTEGDLVPGAMQWGAPDISNARCTLSVPVPANRRYQVNYRSDLTGTASNSEDTSVRMIALDGRTVWSSGDSGKGVKQIDIPAHADAVEIVFIGKIRKLIPANKTRYYQLYEYGIWDITQSGLFDPASVRGVAPELTGALSDTTLDHNSGPFLVNAAAVFTGTALSFAVTGAGASINAETGELTLATDTVISGALITVEASNQRGSVSTSFVLNVAAVLAAPVLIAPLDDEILDEDTGPFIIDASLAFAGENLTYAVTGFGATIDAQTGELALSTETTTAGATITVAASNAAGSVSTEFSVVIEPSGPVDPKAPIEVYYSSFGTDRTADFLSGGPASIQHIAEAKIYGDAMPGAMQWGAPGASNETGILIIPIAFNRKHQVLLRAKILGNGSNTEDTTVRLQDATGTTLWHSGDIGQGTHLLDVPAHPDAAQIRFDGKIRGTIKAGSSRNYKLYEFGIWDITDSGGFPQKASNGPFFWAETLATGVPSRGIDFAEYFDGTLTGYAYDGPEPHSWDGSVLTITPELDTIGQGDGEDGSVARRVFGMNGPLQSVDPQVILVNIKNGETIVGLTERDPGQDWQIELGRPMPSITMERQVYGGVQPYSYTVIDKPDWVTVEENAVCHGIPEAPMPRAPLTIRVTDAAGSTIDITTYLEAIPARDRTPDYVIPSGGVIFDELRARGSRGGVVLGLEPGGTYSWGSTYKAVTASQHNPAIVVGPESATVTGGLRIDQCNSIIFEGFTCKRSITSNASKGERSKNIVAMDNNCLHINLFDLTVRGNRLPVTVPGKSADAGADWINDEPFVTMGVGITAGGNFPVVHRCHVEDVYAGFNINGAKHFTVSDNTVQWFGIDGITINQSIGGVISRNRIERPVGNYSSYTHRDLLQTFANNRPNPSHFCWIDNFASCSGVDEIQGHLFDQDGWNGSNKTPYQGSNYRHIYRDNVVFSSTNAHGANLEYYIDSIFENFLILPHPEVDRTARIYLRKPCQILLKNGIINGYTGDGYDDWFHLVDRENLVDLNESGAPARAEIFPNWAAQDLLYEDPREAVAAGELPSKARFWVDPDSVWGLANPQVGPAWLRTGYSV